MKFSMTEEKGDLSIQVTEWAGLTAMLTTFCVICSLKDKSAIFQFSCQNL
jgi:hypothetical protein